MTEVAEIILKVCRSDIENEFLCARIKALVGLHGDSREWLPVCWASRGHLCSLPMVLAFLYSQHFHLPEPSVITVCSAFEDIKTRQDAQGNPCSLPSVSFIVTLITLQGCFSTSVIPSWEWGSWYGCLPRPTLSWRFICQLNSPHSSTGAQKSQRITLTQSLKPYLHFIGFRSPKSC